MASPIIKENGKAIFLTRITFSDSCMISMRPKDAISYRIKKNPLSCATQGILLLQFAFVLLNDHFILQFLLYYRN